MRPVLSTSIMFALGEEGNPVCKQAKAKAEGRVTPVLSVESKEFLYISHIRRSRREVNSRRMSMSLQEPYLLSLAVQRELTESEM